PTRDAELSFWAKKKKWLLQHKIRAWVSEESYVHHCDDKLDFFTHWQGSSISPIPTFRKIDNHSIERWVAKDRKGSGSRNISLNISSKQAHKLSGDASKDLIFQPFIKGREFTAEAWVSQSGTCHGPLLRWRTKVVNGESHQTVIFHNREWEKAMRSMFLHVPGARGHCLAQVLVDGMDNLHLLEINPRLGGASPLALRAGLNSVAWHLMEETGNDRDIPTNSRFPEGMSLTKQDRDVFFNS
ncbi:MAG: ATP-grasp domain-containing protein, partial [Opitutae bacterium]